MLDNNSLNSCNTNTNKNVICWGIGLGCDSTDTPWRPLQVSNINPIKRSCIDISSILLNDINININIDNTHSGKIEKSYSMNAFNNSPYVLRSNITFADNIYTHIKGNKNISGGLFKIENQSNTVTISGLIISDVSFINPLITILGNTSVIINNLNISNCTFTERGKLLDISNSNVTLMNINISECTSTGFESLISYNSDNLNNLTLTNVNMNNIKSLNSSIIELSSANNIDIYDISISNCDTSSGVIYSHNNITFSNNGYFYNNKSSSNGTVINVKEIVTINGVYTFLDNSTNLQGGAIYANNINLFDASITFDNNYANSEGGAIYAINSCTITGDNTNLHFLNNIGHSGGAIYISSGNLITNRGNITFYKNTAPAAGGAIYLESENNINFISTDISFIHNSAGVNAGAIYMNSPSTLIFNGGNYYFLDNSTIKGGAALQVSNIIIDNSSVITRLDFNNNQGNNILSFDSFDSSRACPEVDVNGCSNIYNFINNTYTNTTLDNTVSLIYFTKNIFMGGGYWNFSDNSYIDPHLSHEYNNYTLLQPARVLVPYSSTKSMCSTCKISIRRSDISFGELHINNCLSTKNIDVSNGGGYYAYTIRTSEPPGAAGCVSTIFTNKYN